MRLALALPLALTFSCAGMSSSTASSPTASSQQCGSSLVAVVAPRGTTIYESPDSATLPIASIDKDTSVCVSADRSGYGFRRVTLANGKTGYIAESSLSL